MRIVSQRTYTPGTWIGGSTRAIWADPPDSIRGRLMAQAVAAFEHVQLIPLDDPLAQEAAELAADRALRGADTVYVAVARRYGCALVSLDREQRERAAPVVRVLTPVVALAELEGGAK